MDQSSIKIGLDFVIQIVEFGAWPALLGFLAVRFGKQFIETIKYIAENLRSGKFGPFEITMAEKMAEAREAAEDAGIPWRESGPPDSGLRTDNEAGGADPENPLTIILSQYQRMTREIEEMAEEIGMFEGARAQRPRTLHTMLRELTRSGKIDHDVRRVIDQLRAIRNELVHSRVVKYGEISPSMAQEFAVLVGGVMESLGARKC